MKLNKNQQISIFNIYNRVTDTPMKESFLSFRRRVQPCIGDNSVMVQWGNIWLGVEVDGYTHS